MSVSNNAFFNVSDVEYEERSWRVSYKVAI